MKITLITVKEVHNYNTVCLTAEPSSPNIDNEILELRAKARRLVEVKMVKRQ